MPGLAFELAQRPHEQAIIAMRIASGRDLTTNLGPGNWSGSTKLQSVRERIKFADAERLRGQTIYVATRDGEVLGSVVVTTFLPSFLKRDYWREAKSDGLGVFNLVVFPEFQRQGIGRFLMESVEQLARDHDIPFVRLDAYSNNPVSTAFYRAIGYEERRKIMVRTTALILFEKDVRSPKGLPPT